VKKNIFFQQYQVLARIARKVRGEDFPRADSYAARDYLCRLLAAECFELGERFKAEGEDKLSLQYMKLTAKLLGLSLRPKKLGDLDEIRKAIAKLKEQKDVAVV
jgi:uncharacterized protein YabN with tetrapyrrole methylase and pyrophosphatase domain